MTAITARFDGEKIVLPRNIRARGSGEVVVTFSDSVVVTTSEPPPSAARSLWDIINDARPSGRTVEEVTRQVRDDRDSWIDPREKIFGESK